MTKKYNFEGIKTYASSTMWGPISRSTWKQTYLVKTEIKKNTNLKMQLQCENINLKTQL